MPEKKREGIVRVNKRKSGGWEKSTEFELESAFINLTGREKEERETGRREERSGR